MSELLREVARHLRHEGSQTRPDPLGVVVVILNQDGTADSFFMGDEEHASKAAQILPGVAEDFVEQLSGAVGFTFPAPELDDSEDSAQLRTPSNPAGLISAERMAAEAISKAKR